MKSPARLHLTPSIPSPFRTPHFKLHALLAQFNFQSFIKRPSLFRLVSSVQRQQQLSFLFRNVGIYEQLHILHGWHPCGSVVTQPSTTPSPNQRAKQAVLAIRFPLGTRIWAYSSRAFQKYPSPRLVRVKYDMILQFAIDDRRC
jgi:hypothetical protein